MEGVISAGASDKQKVLAETPQVVGIEHIDSLVQSSIVNLNRCYSQVLSSGSIKVVCGDGRAGYLPAAPFDAIHVGAGTPQIPEQLLKQLKIKGKLVIPVGHKDH